MSRSESPESRPLFTKKPYTWSQTERASHEVWGRLSLASPRASALAHFLVAYMDAKTNAVVASWRTLAQLTGMSMATVRRAMGDLEKQGWVEGIQLGGGGTKAWVVNSRVAWAQGRDKLSYAAFSARVLASESEQAEPIDNRKPLRQIPVLAPGDRQLPSGPGEDPPSQPALEGMEIDLPAIVTDENGNRWEVDRRTGELQQTMPETDDGQ